MIRIRRTERIRRRKRKRTAGEMKKRRSDEEDKYRSGLFLSALLIYRYCHGPTATRHLIRCREKDGWSVINCRPLHTPYLITNHLDSWRLDSFTAPSFDGGRRWPDCPPLGQRLSHTIDSTTMESLSTDEINPRIWTVFMPLSLSLTSPL